MTDGLPLGFGEATALLAPLAATERVLLAVSGGPDSVALMHLVHHCAGSASWPAVIVASVDHGLQAGSGALAQGVAERARSLGLEAHVLRWLGPKPSTGLQEAAREARYGLLDRLAGARGATHLVTAHTLDDQAETLLFRMARGSGPAGLAGMRGAVTRGAVTHLRPFLAIAKARLVATCRQRGWAFVEDPANHDARFARSRMRALLPLLAAEGLDADTLATLAGRLAMREQAIATLAESLRRSATRAVAPGRASFDAAVLFAEPRALVIAVLQAALAGVGHAGPPRLGRLEALVEQLEQAFRRGEPLTRTLHGTIVRLRDGACLDLTPEGPRHRGRAGSRAAPLGREP